MSKKLSRILAGTLSAVFVGQVLVYGDGTSQGLSLMTHMARQLKRPIPTEQSTELNMTDYSVKKLHISEYQRMKLSITLDTFPTRIMKRSVRRQPLRRIFAALQQGEAHQWTSRSCGCSSNS